jgi:hypothetical protein
MYESNAHTTHQNLLAKVVWIAAEFNCAGPLNFSPFPRETRMVHHFEHWLLDTAETNKPPTRHQSAEFGHS